MGARHEVSGACRRRPPDSVVGILPHVGDCNVDRPERRPDGAAGGIPCERRFHGRWIAEHGDVLIDRRRRNADKWAGRMRGPEKRASISSEPASDYDTPPAAQVGACVRVRDGLAPIVQTTVLN